MDLLIHAELLIVAEEVHEVQVEVQVSETESRILRLLLNGPISGTQIARELGYSQLTGNVRKSLDRLAANQFIKLTIPDNPKSSKQKRKLSPLGIQKAKELLRNEQNAFQ